MSTLNKKLQPLWMQVCSGGYNGAENAVRLAADHLQKNDLTRRSEKNLMLRVLEHGARARVPGALVHAGHLLACLPNDTRTQKRLVAVVEHALEAANPLCPEIVYYALRQNNVRDEALRDRLLSILRTSVDKGMPSGRYYAGQVSHLSVLAADEKARVTQMLPHPPSFQPLKCVA